MTNDPTISQEQITWHLFSEQKEGCKTNYLIFPRYFYSVAEVIFAAVIVSIEQVFSHSLPVMDPRWEHAALYTQTTNNEFVTNLHYWKTIANL